MNKAYYDTESKAIQGIKELKESGKSIVRKKYDQKSDQWVVYYV